MNDLCTDIGAWVGWLGIGYTLLTFWIFLTKPFGLVNEWDVDDANAEIQEEMDTKNAARKQPKNKNKKKTVPESGTDEDERENGGAASTQKLQTSIECPAAAETNR